MFELSVLFSLWAFIILMVGTPGPANLLAMSAGSQLGFYKCISFNLGLTLGKILLNTAMGLGLGVLLVNFTTFQTTIKFIGAGYMIYLALKSWNTNIKNNEGKPNIGWKQGILVHPLNPKAWVMTLIAWTEFGPQLGNFTVQFIVITSSFALTQIFVHNLWSLLGAILSRSLSNSTILSRALILITVAVILWAVLI
ncbi:MAG: LysE family translocator [Candidatus Puniceispirillales bacterium]|tara:strand:- start:388 stop:975 length:588 start_codon:yes stop_codon:yes gene_type:complete